MFAPQKRIVSRKGIGSCSQGRRESDGRMKKPRKHIRSERNIARILAVLSKQRLTAIELADKAYLTPDTARAYLSVLHDQGQVYIVGFQPVDRQKPTRIYAAGNRPDAILIPKTKPRKPNRRLVWKAKVLEALALPGTTQQLADRLGISYAYARVHIYELKQERKIHVTAWLLPAETGSKAAVYKAGFGSDRDFVPSRGVYKQEKPFTPSPSAHGIFAALFAQPSTALAQ